MGQAHTLAYSPGSNMGANGTLWDLDSGRVISLMLHVHMVYPAFGFRADG